MITITKRPEFNNYWLIIDADKAGAEIPYDALMEQQLAELMASYADTIDVIPGLKYVIDQISCHTRKLAILLLALNIYEVVAIKLQVIGYESSPMFDYDRFIGFSWNLAKPDEHHLLEALTNLLEPQTLPRKIPYGMDLGPALLAALVVAK